MGWEDKGHRDLVGRAGVAGAGAGAGDILVPAVGGVPVEEDTFPAADLGMEDRHHAGEAWEGIPLDPVGVAAGSVHTEGSVDTVDADHTVAAAGTVLDQEDKADCTLEGGPEGGPEGESDHRAADKTC